MASVLWRHVYMAGQGLIANERYRQRVLAVGNICQMERTADIGDTALNQLLTLRQFNIYKLQCFVCLSV